MTTKAQERQALQKIREILETLDADGYVRTAFDGVLDIAETNIENDWACSLKEQVESARAGESDWKEKYSRTLEDLRAANARIEKLSCDLDYEQERRKNAEAQYDEAESASYEEARMLRESLQESQLNLSAANREIIELKAKLYDYMTEKKEG